MVIPNLQLFRPGATGIFTSLSLVTRVTGSLNNQREREHLSTSYWNNLEFNTRILSIYEKKPPKVMMMQTEPSLNRRKRASSSCSQVKSIGTHDGKFHCDEVLACFMLRLLPDYSDAQIIRTRNEDVLRTCDVVIDVGGVYDPANMRFDHHQKSFTQSLSDIRPNFRWTTRLSSAGLIYAHFGENVLAQILEKKREDEGVVEMYEKIYENFIEEIDAVDNGISLNDYPMRYRTSTSLSQRVSRLNPSWRDVNPDEWQCFQKALQLVGNEFLEMVHHYASDWWESYSVVKSAVESCVEVDKSCEILELAHGGVPWKDHLAKLEKYFNLDKLIKFVIFSDGKGMWRVQAVPITPDSFILRVPLLEEWRGLRGKELEDISGIPTATFVHANGFIGGAAERTSAIQMAKKTLQRISEFSESE